MRRSTMHLLAISLLSASQVSATQVCATTLQERIPQIDPFVAQLVEDQLFSGAILVVQNGRTLYAKAWGDADNERKKSFTLDTPSNIASITKPITGIILQQLLSEKKLKLGDTLSKFISEFPNGEKIRISHLMLHRSGIPHRVTDDEQEKVPQSAESIARLAQKKELIITPGESHRYSSAGYSVLARVLEIVENKTYAQIVQERIFTPAGMTNAFDATAMSDIHSPSRSYLPTLAGVERAPEKDLSFVVGAGSIYATVGDLSRMIDALRAGKLGDITLKDGNLFTDGFTLIPQSDTKFFSPHRFAFLDFKTTDNPGGFEIVWDERGETFTLPRVP